MAYVAESGERTHRIDLTGNGTVFEAVIDGERSAVEWVALDAKRISLLHEGRSIVAYVVSDGDDYTVSIGDRRYHIRLLDERRHSARKKAGASAQGGRREIRAAMPGKVVDVLVTTGAVVEEDQGLVIVEAMKMENEIRSPSAGTVKEVKVKPGQTVKTGDVLVVVE